MFSLLKKNSAFFIPYLLFLLIGGIILIAYGKVDIALFINGYHCPIADLFFQYWTSIGLGYLVILMHMADFLVVRRSICGCLMPMLVRLKFLMDFPMNKSFSSQIFSRQDMWELKCARSKEEKPSQYLVVARLGSLPFVRAFYWVPKG